MWGFFGMACNFFPDEILNAQIEQDLKNNGQIQEGKKTAINLSSDSILYLTIDTKNIYGLYNEIKG